MSMSPRDRFSLRAGQRTGRFTIQLTFPNGELLDQSLEVTTAMTVPTLQRCLADLLGNRGGVSMFVAPSWARLDHGGLIVASYLLGLLRHARPWAQAPFAPFCALPFGTFSLMLRSKVPVQ